VLVEEWVGGSLAAAWGESLIGRRTDRLDVANGDRAAITLQRFGTATVEADLAGTAALSGEAAP
jgi:hypothetical protein